jgi:hypothetical protein
VRFSQVDIRTEAYEAFNSMLFAPPECDGAVWENQRITKSCSPCERHLGAAGDQPIPMNAFRLFTVAETIISSYRSVTETFLRLPDLFSHDVPRCDPLPDSGFRKPRPYAKHLMPHADYN